MHNISYCSCLVTAKVFFYRYSRTANFSFVGAHTIDSIFFPQRRIKQKRNMVVYNVHYNNNRQALKWECSLISIWLRWDFSVTDVLLDYGLWLVTFLTGMGTQWAGMGCTLMQLPDFRESILRSDAALKDTGLVVSRLLMEADEATFEDTVLAFVGLAAIQVEWIFHIWKTGIVV